MRLNSTTAADVLEDIKGSGSAMFGHPESTDVSVLSELPDLNLEKDLTSYFYADGNNRSAIEYEEMLQTYHELFKIYGIDAERDTKDLASLFDLVP